MAGSGTAQGIAYGRKKGNGMAGRDKNNANLMHLIKRMHGVVENTDIGKQRQSQDHIGALLGGGRDVLTRDLDIPRRERGEDCIHAEVNYVNRPHTKKHIILYCHGGGYSTGSSLYARTLTGKLAMAAGMDVLSFDYRLAPEHPYPAAVEDALCVWDDLMLQGYGAGDVIVAGDSAGGNLALALALSLKEQERFLPGALVLLSPWTDLTSSGRSYTAKAEIDPVLNASYLEEMIANYAGGQDLTDPMISPLFGDFAGFPPTYIQVGGNEILLDDSTALYRRMLKAGVAAKLDIFKGMWHVFQMSPFKNAHEAMDQVAAFLYDIFG